MWEGIGDHLRNKTQDRFESGTAPDGSKWPPSLRALATGSKTLIKSGNLKNFINVNASATGVEVGTNVEYAAIHQFGFDGSITRKARTQVFHFKLDKKSGKSLGFATKKKANYAVKSKIAEHQAHLKMPARPFLGIDDEDTAGILNIASTYVVGGLNARQ
jgi:phage gpG-like protein